MSPRRARGALAAGCAAGAAVVLAAGCSSSSPSMLHTHGPEASRIAGVWWLMFVLAAAVYVVVAGLIFAALLRGRRSTEASSLKENGMIVVGGILVPVVILAVLAVVTVQTTKSVRQPAPDALRIEVAGKRWFWAVTYPDAGVTTANEIHVPAGRPIEMGLDSDNVIHSAWMPQLAGKMDVIPGQHNVLRFEAEQPGVYRGECAEYCGIQHARMNFEIVADAPGDFDRWLVRQQRTPREPTSQAAANGQVVFLREACAGCHTVRGTTAHGDIGPDLTDIGSRKWLGSLTIPNTPENMGRWITNAQDMKPGALMPPVPLSPADRDAVVAYLESLA